MKILLGNNDLVTMLDLSPDGLALYDLAQADSGEGSSIGRQLPDWPEDVAAVEIGEEAVTLFDEAGETVATYDATEFAALLEAALAPDVEAIKAELWELLAGKRWAAEQAGLEIGGMTVKTDLASVARISGAARKAANDPGFSTRWKVGPGEWQAVDAATVLAIDTALADWCQACFTAEEAVSDIVAALDGESTQAEIDGARAAVEAFAVSV